MSINDLKQISQREFLNGKWFGRKSWWDFKEALSGFCISNYAVNLVNKPKMDSVIVEIDTSKPFAKVILELAGIIKKSGW